MMRVRDEWEKKAMIKIFKVNDQNLQSQQAEDVDINQKPPLKATELGCLSHKSNLSHLTRNQVHQPPNNPSRCRHANSLGCEEQFVLFGILPL